MSLTVIIPVKNEENSIENTLIEFEKSWISAITDAYLLAVYPQPISRICQLVFFFNISFTIFNEVLLNKIK